MEAMDNLERRMLIFGIYGQEALLLSKKLGVEQFGFDFRPKSFNFLQGYRFIKLLNSLGHHRYQYFLHYAHDQNFIIDRMIKDVAEQTDVSRKQLILVFSGSQGGEFYQQFGLRFAWFFESLRILSKLVNYDLFQEVILDYCELEFLHGRGRAILLLKEVRDICASRSDVKISLRLPWELDILASVFDFFYFDRYLLAISSGVERAYREVDAGKFTRSFQQVAGQLAAISL